MHTTAKTLRASGYRITIDTRPALIVGYIHAFPHHPDRGSALIRFHAARSADELGLHDPALFGLVSVTWATPILHIDPTTGHRVTSYHFGGLGRPTGTTWYLHPAISDPATGEYTLRPNAYAAGNHRAALPAEVADTLGAPATVKVHDYHLH
ncbi:hypothetical protein FOS14_22130 [Skermania sp. ID1734]|uniref:hypothetical protein n=1 Tax=Skermania sp. ID1734 TaxID=2597516 RepID=UPI0011803BE9|nr:hypothetical protein [Skermania sp. ID1734]TSD93763.1 hypothetical protein FOS14_22130 [Skermania sp. ID1734]